MNHKLLAVPVTCAVLAASLPAHAGSDVESCPAEQYEPCSFFETNVKLGNHERIIDNHVAGFTRSEGTWTIGVRYQPETQCARVDIMVDMGPLDVPRQYREEFRDGAGRIGDSGTFVHRIDDLEDALRILSSSCRVPAAQDPDTGVGDGGSPDEEERERLALEEERERLALERERERLAVEQEQERLALEHERLALEQELEAARELERLEQERARRLAEEERERERLAQQRREQEELERLQAQYQAQYDAWERENAADTSGADALGAIVTSLGLGVLAGAAITGNDEAFDAAAGILTGNAGGGNCDELGERFATDYGAFHDDGTMCSIYRHQYNVMVAYRDPLVRSGCTNAAEWDATIRETHEGVQATCGGY